MKHFACLLLVAVSITASHRLFGLSASSDPEPSNAELVKQMQALAAKVDQLEMKLARYEKAESTATAPAPAAERPRNVAKDVASQTVDATASPASSNTRVIEPSNVNAPLFGLGSRSNAILSIGAYGELKFGGHDAPGGWKDGFDAGRVVLLPTFQVTDNIIFNAEIEFEHGGIASDDDDKLTGSVDIEQAYIDFKL